MNKIFKQISLKAVIVGALFDTVGSLLASFLGGAIILVFITNTHLTKAEILAQFKYIIEVSPIHYLFLLIGLLFTLMGGYVAAVIGKKSPLFNAILVSIPSILVSICIVFLAQSKYSLSYYLVMIVLSVLAAFLGGWVYLKLGQKDYVVQPLKQFGEWFPGLFKGRLSRVNFLIGFLLLALQIVALFVFPKIPDMLIFIVSAPILVPLKISFFGRRWRDIGITSWAVILNFIPVISILVIPIMFLWPGTKGDNKYGQPNESKNRLKTLFNLN